MDKSNPQSHGRINLLIVDDHTSIRQALAASFASSGEFGSVWEAGGADVAVELSQKHQPDVALVDATLPETSGVDAVKMIRKASPRTNVAVFAGSINAGSIAQAIANGAIAYVEKSVSLDELVNAVKTVSRGSTYFGQAVAPVVLQIVREPHIADSGATISSKERTIISKIAEGKKSKQIAAELGRSVRTVENHRRRIMQKTGLRSSAQLALYAAEQGLISRSFTPISLGA